MIEHAIQRWQVLAPRERRLVVFAAGVVLLALIYLLLFEPAWDGRRKLAEELPRQRAQFAQMTALAEEARQLQTMPVSVDSVQALRTALQRSISAAGMGSQLVDFEVSQDLFDLRFTAVPHARWLDWLDTSLRETRMRVATVALTRETAPGMVAVRLVLETPLAGER